LQGGGSHGAFTWGVLDRLIEEPWLRIEGFVTPDELVDAYRSLLASR